MNKTIFFSLTLLLAACSTPYGKYGISGGYRDSQIDENTFSISVETNGFTDQETTSMYALYRAAELTVENGCDYFGIITGGNISKNMILNTPGSSYSSTTVNAIGNTAYASTRTTHYPGASIPVSFPTSNLMIKTFKGEKPVNSESYYDARSVIKYLGKRIGVEKN